MLNWGIGFANQLNFPVLATNNLCGELLQKNGTLGERKDHRIVYFFYGTLSNIGVSSSSNSF